MKEITCDSCGQEVLAEKLHSLHGLVDERDKKYSERAVSQGVAVSAALAAQKEAALKAEHYQAEYNTQHNDLMRKMDHQVETFVGRAEYYSAHVELGKRMDGESSQRQLDKDALVKQIVEIREYNSRAIGEKNEHRSERTQQNWSTSTLLAIAVALIGWVLVIFNHQAAVVVPTFTQPQAQQVK